MNFTTIKHFLFVALVTSALLTLSACDTSPFKPYTQAEDGTITATNIYDDPYLEAERLIHLAKKSKSLTQQLSYRARAARKYIQADEITSAQKQLDLLRANDLRPASQIQTNEQKTDIFLLSADIALHEKNTSLAGQILQKIRATNSEQKNYLLSLNADFNHLSNRYMKVVEHRTELHASLSSENDRNINNKKIWAALSNLSNEQLNRSQLKPQKTKNKTVKGWLELASVMRAGQQNSSLLENDLLDWGTKYPTHPANNSLLRELTSTDTYQNDFSGQRHIAVFLPMQGKFSRVSATIKNGILSAYYEDKESSPKSTVRFYDTSLYNNSSADNNNNAASFQQLYQQAINNGATNIIGPLNKSVINQLVQQNGFSTPILTLNYSENTHDRANNLFQFGLSPEDEARQAAELAIKQNKMRAAIFFPESNWGNRLRNAFSEHYSLLGGRVLTSQSYQTSTNDYRAPIRQLLNLDQSVIRRKKVENTISKKVNGDPYRRHDIDMIFLAATHHSARGIMPAFKFHHAGDLPVYSTSAVYTGKENIESDRDLNGLIFCDLPWILQNTSPLESVFKENWPKQIGYTRLFALGVDAYHLVHNLNYLENKNYGFYAGQTGKIQLDDFNRITRQLLWAKFKKGKPVYFEPVFDSMNNSPLKY